MPSALVNGAEEICDAIARSLLRSGDWFHLSYRGEPRT